MSETDAPAAVTSHRKRRRILRLAAWNGLFIGIALALIALGGEAYFRVTKPFMDTYDPRVFVPEVGKLMKPNTEMRITNRLDFWVAARSNSLGFLDREPSAAGPAAGCPVAIIGDSFVHAAEVPIADKLHIRLEAMAAAELPQLNLTVAAFGHRSTGQVEQLPFYDHYARTQRPRLLVLVFVANDVWNNHPVLRGIQVRQDPQHLPSFSVAQRPDGTLALRPPDPEFRQSRLPPPSTPAPQSWVDRALNEAGKISWFARWLKAQKGHLFPIPYWQTVLSERAELLSRRPQYAPILEGTAALSWLPEQDIADQLAGGDQLPIFAEALEYTVFALGQFRERAARDGAALVILAPHVVKERGPAVFDWLQETAAAQGIPVIDQSDYLRRQGGKPTDAQWRHDYHWNEQGHQWAAEALLEWIKENQEVCHPEPAAGSQPVARN